MPHTQKTLNILGTRGVPAQHGGFETFAEHLALYLVARGWAVTVYCQCEDGSHADGETDMWQGVRRVFFGTKRSGPIGTMEFDYKCVRHVLSQPGVDLVLGYNTAIFNLMQRLRGRRIVMNMDGIEWKRDKWSLPAKIWFYLNEVAGANLCHVAIADHPEIGRHVQRRCFKTPVVIPYGAHTIGNADAPPLGLTPDRYFVSIARIEPENSILEMVQAAKALPDGFGCVVLGRLDDANAYHRAVRAAASDRVKFPGAIYEAPKVAALRYHARAYLHGHQVGGTNPSLVEALGAGNAVLAHDNRFNRWTAGEGQAYFTSVDACAAQMRALAEDDRRIEAARESARSQHTKWFLWDDVLHAYETVLTGQPGTKTAELKGKVWADA